MARNRKAANFEDSLAELEELVEQLEDGDLSLEDSLAAFEKGVRLARECQDALRAAEQRVQVLMQREGGEALAPFADPGADDKDAGGGDTDA